MNPLYDEKDQPKGFARRALPSGARYPEQEGSATFEVGTASRLWRRGELKRVKSRALFVAQLFLKLSDGDLDRLHRNPGDVEPCLDRLQARGRHTRHAVGTNGVETLLDRLKRVGSSIVARKQRAVIGPTPGAVINRRA
jgi:hypothetical protein